MRNDIIVTTKLNVIISSLVTLTWLLAFGLLFRNVRPSHALHPVHPHYHTLHNTSVLVLSLLKAVVPVLALVIVASTLAIRRLYLLRTLPSPPRILHLNTRLDHLSDNECYWLLLAMTWVLLWIMVGVTGGPRFLLLPPLSM